jgi:anthranilate synthase component II
MTVIKILIVDNYDSFTFNIAHIIRSISGSKLQIIEAGKINLYDIDAFDKIIFSPGPDFPREGNVMEEILKNYSGKKSILGICLGLQAIVLYFGGRIKQLERVVHGRKKIITKTSISSKLLRNIPASFEAGLYHSWIADPDNLPGSLEITAISDEGNIMGIKHKTLDIEAVQFHPESIMTPYGEKMIINWFYQNVTN